MAAEKLGGESFGRGETSLADWGPADFRQPLRANPAVVRKNEGEKGPCYFEDD